jgi:hypothetical protein
VSTEREKEKNEKSEKKERGNMKEVLPVERKSSAA